MLEGGFKTAGRFDEEGALFERPRAWLRGKLLLLPE